MLPQGAYVYAVRVDGVVRYVGKGRGYRSGDHERCARAIVRGTVGSYPATRFHHKLADCIRAGQKITTCIIIDGLEDEDAFLVEECEIAIIGKEKLWNTATRKRGGTSEMAKERWNAPGYRENQRQKTTKRWADPSIREKFMAGQAYRVSKFDRAAMSEKIKAKWSDPEYRRKQAERWSNPEMKSRHSAAISASITDEKREAFGKRVSESWKIPEKRLARLKNRGKPKAGTESEDGTS